MALIHRVFATTRVRSFVNEKNFKRQKWRWSCPCAFFLAVHHAMEAYWGRWCISPCILDLRTRWRWVVSFTPRSLYPQWKSPWHLFYRRLDGSQSRSGRVGEEKKSQPLPGFEPLIIQPVAQRYINDLSLLRETVYFWIMIEGHCYYHCLSLWNYISIWHNLTLKLNPFI
jgi:hypothetical protein